MCAAIKLLWYDLKIKSVIVPLIKYRLDFQGRLNKAQFAQLNGNVRWWCIYGCQLQAINVCL